MVSCSHTHSHTRPWSRTHTHAQSKNVVAWAYACVWMCVCVCKIERERVRFFSASSPLVICLLFERWTAPDLLLPHLTTMPELTVGSDNHRPHLTCCCCCCSSVRTPTTTYFCYKEKTFRSDRGTFVRVPRPRLSSSSSFEISRPLK